MVSLGWSAREVLLEVRQAREQRPECRWILDIQVSLAHCRTKTGKENFGQGSTSFVSGLAV